MPTGLKLFACTAWLCCTSAWVTACPVPLGCPGPGVPRGLAWGLRVSGTPVREPRPLFGFVACRCSAQWCRSAFTQIACPHITGWAWLPPWANKPDVPLDARRTGDIFLLSFSLGHLWPLESPLQPGSSCSPCHIPTHGHCLPCLSSITSPSSAPGCS